METESINNEFVKALETEIRREEEDFRDLANDFEFVKELNRELSIKYQNFMDSFPKAAEIDILISKYKEELAQNLTPEQKKYVTERLFHLTKFRSALVMIEKGDNSMKPPKYDEVFGNAAA